MDCSRNIPALAETVAEMLSTDSRLEPDAVAREAGLTFNVGKYGDAFDALLEFRKSRFHVYLNSDRGNGLHTARGRFSFAHELGHFFIDEHRWALSGRISPHGSFTGFCSNNTAEREADNFAAHLLMPSARIKSKARGKKGSGATIRELAGEFGTSLSSTAIHCAILDVFPIIVMMWTREGCAWCWSSSEYYGITRNRARRKFRDIPYESVTADILNSKAHRNADSQRSTTLASWFSRTPVQSSVSEVFVEECLSLGRYGALTILRPDRR
jgi:hypothetical protein